MLRLMVGALVVGVLMSAQIQAASADKDEAKPAEGKAEEFKGQIKEFDEKAGTMKVEVGKDERVLKITGDTKFVMPMGMGSEKFDMKKHAKMVQGGVGKKDAKFIFKAKKGDKEWTLEEIGLDIQLPPPGGGGVLPGGPGGVQVKPIQVKPIGKPVIQPVPAPAVPVEDR